ncbi:hypothetical protein GCM10028801_41090 [Nocardioides maradonensis]
MTTEEARLAVAQVWRVKKTGALRTITVLRNHGSNEKPYYDVGWETTEKPFRRGATYEEYFRRNCEFVSDPNACTCPPSPTNGHLIAGDCPAHSPVLINEGGRA